jgi:uncharacterized protein (TIGR00159 family)
LPILNFIPTPTWRDFVDILFLTVVAYQLYEWFRETRALRVIIGLAVLGGIFSIAKMWGLFLTTRVFQILWQVLLILLLILFQTEIRQVLERVSPLRFLRSRRRGFRRTFAKDLADTLFDLAADGTGALIVLTRDDNPAEFIQAGQKIMALPDAALIKSIFNRHSPAHDGAVIFSQDRLTHMGCILPLSENENIPKHYGTRHRAALGISEKTDAVCLVVSEERAEVISVVGGKATVWQDPASMAAQLKEWTGGPEIQMPKIQTFLTEIFVQNWKSKLSALAMVSIAWVALASQQEIELTVTAPIRYLNIASGLAVNEDAVKTVELTLAGRRNSIRSLAERDIQVLVDLNRLTAGPHYLNLSARNVDLPLALKIQSMLPQKIIVILNPRSRETPSD